MQGGKRLITDEELYLRLTRGDEGALEALVHRYHSPLLGYLYRQTADRHLAEDLVQETFTRLVTYQGEPPRRFKAWAFTVAGNLMRDHYRLAYHRREQPDTLEGGSELPDLGAPVDELLLRDDDRREVVEALQTLPENQREVILLRFYHEMSIEEIAEVTGAPEGTVKSRIYYALRHLKARLGQEGGNGSHGSEHTQAQRSPAR